MAEENKEVVEVIEEEVKQPQHQWTFLKYVKSIAHFKWWIIGFSVFGAVAGYLGFRLILNPMQKKLSATFTYDLAGSYDEGNSDTLRFIDGTTFSSYDLTSRENLQKVKDTNPKFSGIDIDKIASSNAISLTKNVNYYNEADASSSYVTYTITSKASTFPNDSLGKEFLFALVNLPKTLSTNAINNFNAISYFTDNFETLNFEKEINQLNAQYLLNDSVYSNLSNIFGSSVVGNENGSKIYELQNKYTSKYFTSGNQTFIEELSSTKDVNKFVNYVIGQEDAKIAELHEQCGSYIEAIEQNNKQIAIYQNSLDTLTNSAAIIGSDTNVSAQIVKLDDNIRTLKLQNNSFIKSLNGSGYFFNDITGKYEFDPLCVDSSIYKLTAKEENWVVACSNFKSRIENYKDSLETDRQEVTSVYRYCYANYKNRVNVQNGGYVQLSGGVSNLIGAAAGLVALFAITSLVTAAIYVYREKEE